jgi:hypothetical protein
MAESQQIRKSALRNIGGLIFIAATLLLFGVAPESFWSGAFWSGDVVSATFHWFFTTFKFYPALTLLAYVIYVVERRVKQGDPIKEDLSLILTIVSILVTVFSIIPSEFRDEFYSWLKSLH